MIAPSRCHILLGALAVFVGLPTISRSQLPTDAAPHADVDFDHVRRREEWFLHGRNLPGQSSAELRRRAYAAKMRARVLRESRARANGSQPLTPSTGWTPLGPVPLASDATGDGFQDYGYVSGRATAVTIDPADATGRTVFVGGAQGGVWKSTNATDPAASVAWSPLTDDQATLSIGAIAIQPGNSNPATSVVLVGTGEANNAADSYFGLGILRSVDGGNTWSLESSANAGAYSFSGLGTTRMAFSTFNPSTVIAAMAASSEGAIDGALTSNTYRGLYTSTDAGQTWAYDTLFSGANEATSATSVVYNAAAGLFFAALRYHGIYSSPDGLTWTRLTVQPGVPGLLSAIACPQNYLTTCPIYRAEITVVPGRNELYVWFISLDAGGNPVDQGIWLTLNSGASWSQIGDSAIANCGDPSGCGVEQGFYNLDLLAVPNCPGGAPICQTGATDLYAGAINLYKCTILSPATNPACNAPFLNLTHVYGCNPLSAPAHVHPDQHAMAFEITSAGTDLMYFANDGGLYRALDGFTGLPSGACTVANQFDDLNQDLGSMTQFVAFSQHATDTNTLLGGTQDNGSPATASATTSASWGNVLSGDGGFNAIDSVSGNWFTSNPDVGGGTLNIYECNSGIHCNDSLFTSVVNSGNIGGDDGAFYFPYMLDPQSTSSLLLGTCRVWSGPRSGGAFKDLSLNFDTLGLAACAGNEVNTVRGLAAGGPTNTSGSLVVYATTDGLGPASIAPPIGGNVWVTTNATPISGVNSTFSNTTLNGPGGVSINPNQFPVSSVAIDNSDPTGNTAYVAIMGFTGGAGHVWQTTNAGASWTDFSGSSATALPDSPANAVVVDSTARIVYVGTDVGVFQSLTSSASWIEVGPVPGTSLPGFLPDVAVTGLALFDSGGERLLRASTYGRGIWQFNLVSTPDFAILISNTPLTTFPNTNVTFDGTLIAENGYNNSVELSCTPGTSSPPSPCTPNPVSLTPTSAGAAFQVAAGVTGITDYNFNVQGTGSDPQNTTHSAAVTLHVVNLTVSTPSPGSVSVPDGTTSAPVSFQLVAQGTFTQSVTMSCAFSPPIAQAACNFTPAATVFPTSKAQFPMTAAVVLQFGTSPGKYTVTLQAETEGAPQPITATFQMTVTSNPTFVLALPAAFPEVNAGSTGTTGSITVTAEDGFTGTVSMSCISSFGAGSCSISPTQLSVFPATATLTINGNAFSAGAYQITVQGTSGSLNNSVPVSFNVGDYTLTGPSTASAIPGGIAAVKFTITSTFNYSGQVTATCDASALAGTLCSISPANPIAVASGAAVNLNVSLNVPNDATPNTYSIKLNTQDSGGAPSHSLTLALTVGQAFTIGSLSPSSQTISTGQSASFNFSVLPDGASFTGTVSLACSGAPAISVCAFTPNPVTPGGTSVAVVLNVSTTKASSQTALPIAFLLTGGFLLPALAICGSRTRRSLVLLAALSIIAALPSCGGGTGGGGSSGGQHQGTQPGTYSISVIGTSNSIVVTSPPVTLTVNP